MRKNRERVGRVKTSLKLRIANSVFSRIVHAVFAPEDILDRNLKCESTTEIRLMRNRFPLNRINSHLDILITNWFGLYAKSVSTSYVIIRFYTPEVLVCQQIIKRLIMILAAKNTPDTIYVLLVGWVRSRSMDHPTLCWTNRGTWTPVQTNTECDALVYFKN